MIVRESTEGLFASHGKGEMIGDDEARETLSITRGISEKLFDFAFDLARTRKAEGRGPGRVTCVDKANVFRAFAFFRRIFRERGGALSRHRSRSTPMSTRRRCGWSRNRRCSTCW